MDAAQITALCGGIVTIITALATLIATLKGNRQVKQVQETVNGHATARDVRIDQLTATLSDNGVVIPPAPVVIVEPPAV